MTVHSHPSPENEKFACAWTTDPPLLALVVKRTYEFGPDGTCSIAGEQMPVHDDVVLYHEAEPPGVSPPKWDNDLFAFKTRTDIIVQGSAHTYGSPAATTTVELEFAGVQRSITVFGDRRVDKDGSGTRVFTPPEPFEKMPLRYDRAYGGQDLAALERFGDPVEEIFGSVRPEWQLSTTSPYHYPRNPAGKGYLIENDSEDFRRLEVPNLEWPWDPLTPDRLVAGAVTAWPRCPLPAGFDWYEQSWFPRSAYIGIIPEHNVPISGFREIELGLAGPDLIEPRSLIDMQLHPMFVQGASPGLAVNELKADETFRLVNLCPDKPQATVTLPGDIPWAKAQLPMRGEIILRPFLNTVVIRPDDHRVIMVWSCSSEVERPYGEPEFEHIPYELNWSGIQR